MGNLMPSDPSQRPTRRPVFVVMLGQSVRAWVVIVSSTLINLVSGTAAAGEDPLEWRPPASKTQFRKLLSDADYQRLSAPVVSRLPQALKEASSKLPDHGLKISGVFAPGALRRRVSPCMT